MEQELNDIIYGIDTIQDILIMSDNKKYASYSITDKIYEIAKLLGSNKSVKRLTIYKNNLGGYFGQSIFDCLKTNTTLHTLVLDNNNIGKAGIIELAKILNVNNSLTTLVLTKNFMEDIAATSLADNMKNNTGLTSLDISDNYIGADGATAITNNLGNIQYLFLGKNRIGSTGTAKIYFGKLVHLNLSNNHLHDKEAAEIGANLKHNNTLTYLNISDNKIRYCDAISKSLKYNITLQHLDLSYNCLCDGAVAICKSLVHNIALKHLNLSFTNIDREGINEISRLLMNNNVLEYLNLSYNNITDATGLALMIENNQTIHTLNIEHNSIACPGGTKIMKALSVNHSLTSLFIGNNPMYDVANEICNMLILNNTLRTLSIYDSVWHGDMDIIIGALKNNHTLTELHNRPCFVRNCEYISRNKEIENKKRFIKTKAATNS